MCIRDRSVAAGEGSQTRSPSVTTARHKDVWPWQTDVNDAVRTVSNFVQSPSEQRHTSCLCSHPNIPSSTASCLNPYTAVLPLLPRWPKLSDKLWSFCKTRKEDTVLNRLHIGLSYLTHSFILEKEEEEEEPLVCVACNTIIIIKHILSECADLVEVRCLCIDFSGM